VQVYVKPPHPTPLTASALDTITRSSKELKGFAKINLDAGADGRAEVKLDVLRATSYWNEREDYWCSDAGDYAVLVGTSSRCQFLEKTFTIRNATTWRGLRT
jgi:beta-glucosidase